MSYICGGRERRAQGDGSFQECRWVIYRPLYLIIARFLAGEPQSCCKPVSRGGGPAGRSCSQNDWFYLLVCFILQHWLGITLCSGKSCRWFAFYKRWSNLILNRQCGFLNSVAVRFSPLTWLSVSLAKLLSHGRILSIRMLLADAISRLKLFLLYENI